MSAMPSGPAAATSETSPQSAEKGQGKEMEDRHHKKKQRKSLGNFFKQAAAAEVSIIVSYTEKIEGELSSYLVRQLADSGRNPLIWWKVHEKNFPVIGRLAKKYLCIPATSTASERVFSAGRNVVTYQWSLLTPTTINMLVFLTKNLQVRTHLKLVHTYRYYCEPHFHIFAHQSIPVFTCSLKFVEIIFVFFLV